jgi:hypothetical protein
VGPEYFQAFFAGYLFFLNPYEPEGSILPVSGPPVLRHPPQRACSCPQRRPSYLKTNSKSKRR